MRGRRGLPRWRMRSVALEPAGLTLRLRQFFRHFRVILSMLWHRMGRLFLPPCGSTLCFTPILFICSIGSCVVAWLYLRIFLTLLPSPI